MKVFRKIGIAVAVSPGIDALLAEAHRYASAPGGDVELIHVGARTPEKEQAIRDSWARTGSAVEPTIVWRTGSPADEILGVIRSDELDLIIAGANERESLLRGFFGSVARALARDADASVLLITAPQKPPRAIRRIAVNLDFDDDALVLLRRSLRLAARLASSEIDIVHVSTKFAEDIAYADGVDARQLETIEESDVEGTLALMRDYVDAAGISLVPVRPQMITGNRGQALVDFARRQNVDLMIVPAMQRGLMLERIFLSDLERLLQNIPCHLLLARPPEDMLEEASS
ncbi:MAG TPA: universal stress protein [Candidatus Kapabacteria bacterium]|jgi:nucleotide-binding universal stress UspA family protein|nr:universal stress protein [Candidatus Kapabacteria bacterium]